MAKRPAAPKKIDIFVILDAFDRNDYTVYDQVAADPEALAAFRKEIGYMLPIWMTGASRDSDHIELIERFNANCNKNWFALSKHPRMQAKLLASIGLGRRTAHRFNKVRAAPKGSALGDFLRQEYPDIRENEVVLWTKRNTLEQTEELARSWGLQEDQLKELRKSYQEVRQKWE
jgi:hypothetical protein